MLRCASVLWAAAAARISSTSRSSCALYSLLLRSSASRLERESCAAASACDAPSLADVALVLADCRSATRARARSLSRVICSRRDLVTRSSAEAETKFCLRFYETGKRRHGVVKL